jgi:hypothetical protein
MPVCTSENTETRTRLFSELPPDSTVKDTLPVYITRAMAKELDHVAQKNMRTRSSEVRVALEQYLEQQRPPSILDGKTKR